MKKVAINHRRGYHKLMLRHYERMHHYYDKIVDKYEHLRSRSSGKIWDHKRIVHTPEQKEMISLSVASDALKKYYVDAILRNLKKRGIEL